MHDVEQRSQGVTPSGTRMAKQGGMRLSIEDKLSQRPDMFSPDNVGPEELESRPG